MAFIFTCGTHTFKSLLQGYENITVQCQNCGNFSGKIIKKWEWFTFCFVPIIPFSLKPWHAVHCHICDFTQELKYRPDVQQQMNGGWSIPMQNPQNQGWGPGGGGGQQQQQQQGPYYNQGPYNQGPPGGQSVYK